MKYFAITPNKFNPDELSRYLPILQKRAVSHLYLRTPRLHATLEELVVLIRQHEIIPIIPRSLHQTPISSGCGMHTRSDEHFDSHLNPSGIIQTAACHSAEAASTLLDKGADYVFISPVYRPFSKPGDQRLLITTDALRMITRRYGSRIVLLGGLTQERIKELHTILDTDFSVAGISMFFNTGKTHEQAST
jgi:thiamine monophosphate synthase